MAPSISTLIEISRAVESLTEGRKSMKTIEKLTICRDFYELGEYYLSVL